MRIAGLVLVILLAFTFSCGPIWWEGNKFDPAKRDQIVKSRTTAGELESLMGKPYKAEKMGGGKEKYVYYYKHEEFVHWYTLPKATMQKLEVDLANGVVMDYTYDRVSTDPMRD
jgi:hypothetical protein